MGLLAKNAILIVQFALERRQTGMAISWSAVLGASARLRPILMTSLAMIIGLLPLLMPWGVGYNGNMTLGAAAVGGMLIGMLCQIMIVPLCSISSRLCRRRLSLSSLRATLLMLTLRFVSTPTLMWLEHCRIRSTKNRIKLLRIYRS